MNSEDLANAVESIVLKTVMSNIGSIMVEMALAIDKKEVGGLDLVQIIQSKMPTTPPPVPLTAAPVVQIADAQITELTKALQGCLSGTRAKFIGVLCEAGLTTENYVDDKVGDYVLEDDLRSEIMDIVDDKCLDEDRVKELINGAWNGA